MECPRITYYDIFKSSPKSAPKKRPKLRKSFMPLQILNKAKVKKKPQKKFTQTVFAHTIKCPDCNQKFTNVDYLLHQQTHKILEWNVDDGIHTGHSKATELLEYVNTQLGAAQEMEKVSTYVYVLQKKIVGVLVCKAVKEAFLLQDRNTLSEKRVACICGVSRIWVHPNQRHKGIASKLLDYCLEHYLFGTTLTKDELSFSQPTEMGYLLGCKYFGRKDFPVYLD